MIIVTSFIETMGKASDLTLMQKIIIGTLHEGKKQKDIASRAGCSQSSVSKFLHGKAVGRKKCDRKLLYQETTIPIGTRRSQSTHTARVQINKSTNPTQSNNEHHHIHKTIKFSISKY